MSPAPTGRPGLPTCVLRTPDRWMDVTRLAFEERIGCRVVKGDLRADLARCAATSDPPP